MDSSFHLTVMPLIDNVAFPVLARSGYWTLFPDTNGAFIWAESLGLACAPTEVSVLLGETLGVAAELGAMNQLRLGTEGRSAQEKIARHCLEDSFAKKKDELFRQLPSTDCEIQTDISTLIKHLQTGNVDLLAESQKIFDGNVSEIMRSIAYLTLRLIEYEWLMHKNKSELQETRPR